MNTQVDFFWQDNTGGDQAMAYPYMSGMSRPADFHAALASGCGVGVEALELSRPMIQHIADTIAQGKHVFVDSGAFNQHKRIMRGIDAAALDFEQVFTRYLSISDAIKEQDVSFMDAARLMLVMPDSVGDQIQTLELLERYQDRIMELAWRGHEIIVPFQSGPIPQASAFARTKALFQSEPFVVGLPTNAKALSDQDTWELLDAGQPERIHILGAITSERFHKRMTTIRHVYRDDVPGITADACALRSQLDKVKGQPQSVRMDFIRSLGQKILPVIWQPGSNDQQNSKAA
jgi:hypothetical protein